MGEARDIVRRLNEAILGLTGVSADLLADAKAEIYRLRDGAELAALLDQAEDAWTDYGAGFRIHFSFAPSHRSDVVLRVNRRRAALAKAAPTPSDRREGR